MPTKIKRGQSLLIPFKDGMTIYDSQNKPRMYLSQKAFENSFPRHLIDIEGVELVEYAEVVRCKDCKFSSPAYIKPEIFKRCSLFCKTVNADFFCGHGEKMDAEVEG